MRVMLLLLVSFPVMAVESIQWEREPIELELIVGVEQLIHFEQPPAVGLPPLLRSRDVFRHLLASDTVYWKALRPFGTERIKVKLGDETLLFDVSAKSMERPPKAVEAKSVLINPPEAADPNPINEHMAPLKEITMFDLLRYAAQINYSPHRLITPVDGIREVEHGIKDELSGLYRDPFSRSVDIFVWKMWEAGGLYVTALKVRNRTHMNVHVKISRMQHTAVSEVNGVDNRFIAGAMIEPQLGPRGEVRDQSMMYLVTRRPFNEVIILERKAKKTSSRSSWLRKKP